MQAEAFRAAPPPKPSPAGRQAEAAASIHREISESGTKDVQLGGGAAHPVPAGADKGPGSHRTGPELPPLTRQTDPEAGKVGLRGQGLWNYTHPCPT